LTKSGDPLQRDTAKGFHVDAVGRYPSARDGPGGDLFSGSPDGESSQNPVMLAAGCLDLKDSTDRSTVHPEGDTHSISSLMA
jgi:hypothetical protein